jgi:predicted DsbA family dithiol-disulfide isomerase
MHIDVYHDTVCPWCRVGERNLHLALEQWTGEPVTVAYKTFFLNPDVPESGYDFREYMLAKGGGRIPLEGFFAGPREAGKLIGLTFNFEAISKAPNTIRSHELILLTPEAEREAMIRALYEAYFEHGRDIGDLDVLVAIAEAQGLDPEATRASLLAGEQREAVMAEASHAYQLGITGVPFFLIEGKYGFSGAQPPDTILNVLHKVLELRQQEATSAE